jgi:hypothetical protein
MTEGRTRVTIRHARKRADMGNYWALPRILWSGYAGCKMTRLRRRGKLARPYIWRLVCPERGGGSVGRVSEAMLHGR